VDFILVRYGLNDHGVRQDFAANFPLDLRELVRRLKVDHPGCQVILETVIPYFGEPADKQINDLIRAVAADENLPLLDTHARHTRSIRWTRPRWSELEANRQRAADWNVLSYREGPSWRHR
jgi:hypothetical protein